MHVYGSYFLLPVHAYIPTHIPHTGIPLEPTTAVVRGGKRSLRARITAEGGSLKRDVRRRKCMFVCLSVCLSVCRSRYCDVT